MKQYNNELQFKLNEIDIKNEELLKTPSNNKELKERSQTAVLTNTRRRIISTMTSNLKCQTKNNDNKNEDVFKQIKNHDNKNEDVFNFYASNKKYIHKDYSKNKSLSIILRKMNEKVLRSKM